MPVTSVEEAEPVPTAPELEVDVNGKLTAEEPEPLPLEGDDTLDEADEAMVVDVKVELLQE